MTLGVFLRVPVSLLMDLEAKIPPRSRSRLTRMLWRLYIDGKITVNITEP